MTYSFIKWLLVVVLLFSASAIQLRSFEQTAPDQVSKRLKQAAFQNPAKFLSNTPEEFQLKSNIGEGVTERKDTVNEFKVDFDGDESSKHTIDLAETSEVLGIKSSNILFADTMKMHRADLKRKAEALRAQNALAQEVYEALKEEQMKNGDKVSASGEKSKLLDEALLQDQKTQELNKVGTALSAEYFERASTDVGAAVKMGVPFSPESGIPAITVIEEQDQAVQEAKNSQGPEAEQTLMEIQKKDGLTQDEGDESEEDEGDEGDENDSDDESQTALVEVKSKDEPVEDEGDENEEDEGEDEDEIDNSDEY